MNTDIIQTKYETKKYWDWNWNVVIMNPEYGLKNINYDYDLSAFWWDLVHFIYFLMAMQEMLLHKVS